MMLYKRVFGLFFLFIINSNVLAADDFKNITTANFVGDWKCGLTYENLDIGTLEIIHFKDDGKFTSEGAVLSPLDNPIFAYKITSYGKWQVENGYLIQEYEKQIAQRKHSKKLEEKLKSSPKAQQWEQMLFDMFNNATGILRLKITDYELNSFRYLESQDDERYYGGCRRLDDKE